MQAWLPQGDAFLKCFSSALWMESSSSISALLSHSQTSGIQFSADGNCSTSWLPKGFLLLADKLLHFDKLLLQWRALVNFEWRFSGNYYCTFPKWMYPFQRNGTAEWFSSYRNRSTAPEISVLPIYASAASLPVKLPLSETLFWELFCITQLFRLLRPQENWWKCKLWTKG